MYTNGGFEADLFDGSFQPQPSKHRASFRPPPPKFAAVSTSHFHHAGVWGFRGFNPETDAAAVVKHSNAAAAEDAPAEGQAKCRACFKRFGSVMLSQLGTFVIVICYVVMGGFLFQYLEVENEVSSCQTKYDRYLSKRNEAVDRIYNMAQNGKSATEAKANIFNEISSFARDVFTLSMDPRLNCTTLGEGDNIPYWNFANAAYFCVTIITTIGYGHISPGTSWGQIVCMIYAILGIPLMLLFLTKIGEPTALLFKAFYLNICCCKCFIKRKSAEERAVAESIRQQQQQQGQQCSWTSAEEGNKLPPAKVNDLVVVEEEDDEDDEEEDIVNIPISVTILLLILYILLGASVFRIWEKWTLVEGTYFSFITLSTIGFGDYVPGKDGPFNSKAVITELLVGALYCFFGLTVLSMCINLIQDEISAKFHWIGLKLGMVKRIEEPSEDDSDDESSNSDSSSSSGDTPDDGMSRKSSAATNSSRRNQRHHLTVSLPVPPPPPPPPPPPRRQLNSGRHIMYDSENGASSNA